MLEEYPFTINSFYMFLTEERLMASKCNECGTILLPPKPMCTSCLSNNMNWTELEGSGKILSYTVIHIAPEQFQSIAPYSVGIIEFKNGLRLPGMIRDEAPKKLKVGMQLKICFDKKTSDQWPPWSRYYFKPL